MRIHDIADELRRAFPHAVSVQIHVNADEVTVETKHYDGRGDYSMRQLDGTWARPMECDALDPTA